jgi:uncharacterized protein
MYVIIRFLRIILVGILIYVLYKILWKGDWFPSLFSRHSKGRGNHPQSALEELKRDPVCGAYIPGSQAIQHRTGGETRYFCSEECKQKFLEQEKQEKKES